MSKAKTDTSVAALTVYGVASAMLESASSAALTVYDAAFAEEGSRAVVLQAVATAYNVNMSEDAVAKIAADYVRGRCAKRLGVSPESTQAVIDKKPFKKGGTPNAATRTEDEHKVVRAAQKAWFTVREEANLPKREQAKRATKAPDAEKIADAPIVIEAVSMARVANVGEALSWLTSWAALGSAFERHNAAILNGTEDPEVTSLIRGTLVDLREGMLACEAKWNEREKTEPVAKAA